MEYEQFSTIYNALKSISSNNDLNKDDVIKAIKNQLSQNLDAYKEWEKGNFSLDHVFTTVNNGVESKHTLLTAAFNREDSKVANFLIKKVGADVNAVGVDGLTPLIIAIEKECGDPKHKELVDLLMKANADVNAAGGKHTPISKAVERGNLRVFEALIAKGVNVDVKPPHGKSLLEWAESHEQYVENKEDMKAIINTLKAPSKEKKQTDPEIATSTNIDNLKQTDEAESTIPVVTEVKEPVAGTSSETLPNDAVSDNLSQEKRDADYALECQIKEIVRLDDGQLPENNSTNLPNEKSDLPDTSPPVVPATTDTGDVSATINSNTSPAPTIGSKTNGADLPGNKKKDTVVNNAATTPANSSETSPAPTTGNKTPEKNDTTFWSEHKGKIALGVVGLCAAGAIAAYVLAYPAVTLALAVLAAVILMGAGIAKVCEKLENPNADKVFTDKNKSCCVNQ